MAMSDQTDITEFRRHAEASRKRALATSFPDLKLRWEDLAREYDEMADRAELAEKQRDCLL